MLMLSASFYQDQKKLQGQPIAEQEAFYGSKPSPLKTHMVKKAPRMSTGGAGSRRLSLGVVLQTPKPDTFHPTKGTPNARAHRKSDRVNQVEQLNYQDNGLAVLSASKFLSLLK